MNQDRYISEAEAAKITGMSRGWFQHHRHHGTGIPFVKMGPGKHARVRYKLRDVKNYMVRTNTSEEVFENVFKTATDPLGARPVALVIDKDVPMPVQKRAATSFTAVLRKLKPGHSVVLPLSTSRACCLANKVLGTGKFVTRMEGGNARVWRAE